MVTSSPLQPEIRGKIFSVGSGGDGHSELRPNRQAECPRLSRKQLPAGGDRRSFGIIGILQIASPQGYGPRTLRMTDARIQQSVGADDLLRRVVEVSELLGPPGPIAGDLEVPLDRRKIERVGTTDIRRPFR